MKIAIIGSSSLNDQGIINTSEELGKLIASKGHVVVTGGTPGYPNLVANSALSSGGKAIAYCTGKTIDDHQRFYQTDLSKYSELIYQKEYVGDGLSKIDLYIRSLKLCFDVDMAIVIGGHVGTMYEITILAGIAKDIYVLSKSGGITNTTIKEFMNEGHKKESKIEFFDTIAEIKKYL